MKTMTGSRGLLALASMLTLVGCIFMHDGLPRGMSESDRARVYEAVYVHKHAVQLFQQRKVHDAIAVAQRAAELLESVLGPMHLYVAVPLRSLAVFHHSQGDYTKAEPQYTRVVAILEKALGPRHIDLAARLDELAALYMQWGIYHKAESLYHRALTIREKGLGVKHPDVVESLNNLALAFEKQGEYGKAESMYSRALALAEQVLGPRHRNVARGLNGLAMVYWTQGVYARAEPLLVRSLTIRETLLVDVLRFGPGNLPKIGGDAFQVPRNRLQPMSLPQHVLLNAFLNELGNINSRSVQSLSNLHELYSTAGPNTTAEPLLARTADIFETVLETAQSDVSQSVGNLAQFYVATGAYKRAEPLLVRTLDAKEQTLGATHPDLANSLNNLAQLYQTQGEYAKAERLLVRVLAIRKQTLGETHADVGRALNNLALLYRMQGAYAKAEPLQVQALTTLERALGEKHADVARSLNNLALIYHEQGSYAAAEPLYQRAIAIMFQAVGMNLDVVRYLNNLAVLYHASGNPEKAEPLMLRAAGVRESQLQLQLARLSASRKRALMMLLQQETESLVSLHADSTPESARAFELALTAVLRRKGLALESLAANQAVLRAHLTPFLRNKLDQLTAASTELAALVHAPLGSRTATGRASAVAALRTRIDTLESQLNEASAAAIRARSPSIVPARIQEALPHNTALIDFVHYRRFDPRQDRQRWFEARYLAYVLKRQGQPQWVALGPAAPIDAAVDAVLARMHRNANVDETKAALQQLHALLLAPLRDHLANVPHIVVSPDHKLNLVPFEALVDSQGRYELEHRLVSYVTSGRDLLQLGVRRAPRSPAAIVAAPDYGRGRSFVPLVNAGTESREVSAYFSKPTVLTGGGATKAALASLAGPAVLHIATHGFLARGGAVMSVPPPKEPPARLPSFIMLDPERDMFVEGVLAPSILPAFDDPTEALERVGLALANANTIPDGIVTAREIMNYDWWGTRLVVLSACATGVGVMPSGDGVYGLRRALALAGADSQVVSLWNVSDSSARVLMREFYGELAVGNARAEALRRAKRWMLRQPKLAHPYYWAAFILAGDWRTLERSIMLPPRRSS